MHVTKILENPYEVIETNKKKWSFLMKKRLVNRQSYPKKFMFITGSLYFFTRNFFLKNQKMINSKTYPYKVDRINFVDIDDLFTFELSKNVSSLKIRD
jgi:CMP-N-acetylneuraminic acid synthetase